MSIYSSFSNTFYSSHTFFCCQNIYFLLWIFLSASPSPSAPSLRLAYKDLEQHRKIEEQKLKGLDGKKKEQAERLGMGLGIRRYEDIQDVLWQD